MPSTMWQQRLHTDDPDAHARAQRGWALHYEQLSEGRFAGLVHHVQLPGARLVHEHCRVAVRQRGQLGDGTYGFAMALRGDGGDAIFNGQRVAPDAVMLGRNGAGTALDLCTPPDHGLIAVVVDAELLVPLWTQLYGRPPSAWMQAHLVVPARPVVAASLRQHQLQALARAGALLQAAGPGGTPDHATACRLRDDLLIEWFEALPAAVDATALPHALARKRLVDQACALMLERCDEPPSMLAVCRTVGASRRKLNYCFQDVLGQSPVKYLRRVRLNGARRALRDGTADSVQTAAARWGFWHLGQFAQDYRRQFGELPSQTLRARGAPPATREQAA